MSGDSDDMGHISDGAMDTEINHDVEALYAITKAIGDAECEAGTTCSKSDRTADVFTIFVKKDDYLDTHTGSLKSGHICTICKKKGLAARHCFFKGGMSTLCTHIARQVPSITTDHYC
ncbi:hypothetical protein BDR03DRAFT_1009096 [Suillus americanus]|nr:hypothetical protein BDR03DRAFT_1009096 [Suillus americanus]